jgi:hypothetical protein
MTSKNIFHFESKLQPLLSQQLFAKRLVRNGAVAVALVAISLFAGMCGYHYLEKMPWLDSFTNAAMILSGMGPLGELKHWQAKLFAGCYALYSGLIVVIAAGFILAPIIHRIMHRFHAEDDL